MAKLEKPVRLYGSKISYYTGKMEGYLRFKEIGYDFVVLGPENMRKVRKATGASQMPVVELPDGRMMTDTTPMIDWFEAEFPDILVTPIDPVQRFFSKLVEDYAEEWLWRPAMHYRWSYRPDSLHLSRKIVDELMAGLPLPGPIKRLMIRTRQHFGYVKWDGVTQNTWDHVESIYLDNLARLEAIFQDRPYLLGNSPSLADFGFFASMFRHFAQDPTASELMRTRAPAVFEWQARLWNAKGSEHSGDWLPGIPEDWAPILKDIGEAYLPFLNANAIAWQKKLKRFDVTVQSVHYRQLPVSRYRVWCLAQLQGHFEKSGDATTKSAIQAQLTRHGCWQSLFELDDLDCQYDPEGKVPFHGRKVHYDNE